MDNSLEEPAAAAFFISIIDDNSKWDQSLTDYYLAQPLLYCFKKRLFILRKYTDNIKWWKSKIIYNKVGSEYANWMEVRLPFSFYLNICRGYKWPIFFLIASQSNRLLKSTTWFFIFHQALWRSKRLFTCSLGGCLCCFSLSNRKNDLW